MSRLIPVCSGLLLLCLLTGCEQQPPVPEAAPVQPAAETSDQTHAAPDAAAAPDADAAAAGESAESEPAPPAPPVLETFEGEPQLTLFPRVGSYRPEDGQNEQLGYWNTFIEHLLRTSGVTSSDQGQDNRVFAMRGVAGIDSSGFFSPLQVEPEQQYRLSFRNRGELSADEQAGAGLLEFDEFLWIPGQYPESVSAPHQVGRQLLKQLQSSSTWQQQEIVFTTGPRTRMIHLIFYRDGKVNRQPLLLDDIRLEAMAKAGS